VKGVQQALLKIPRGHRSQRAARRAAASTRTRSSSRSTPTNILFICGGAFVGLEKQIEPRTGKKTLGFKADVKSLEPRHRHTLDRSSRRSDQVRPHSRVRRPLPVVGTLHELDKAALVQILTQPRNAITRQYQKLFEYENVKLRFTDDSLEAIAERRSRARSARAGCG
jgi:ATP-dependent Clp protease ATP-binding subunit ClpX